MIRRVSQGIIQDYRFYDAGQNVGEFSLVSPSDVVNVAELRGFEIYPAYRGKGHSYAMLAFAVKCARTYNFPILALKVKSDNKIAIQLYENSGFVTKRTDTERSELMMELDLE